SGEEPEKFFDLPPVLSARSGEHEPVANDRFANARRVFLPPIADYPHLSRRNRAALRLFVHPAEADLVRRQHNNHLGRLKPLCPLTASLRNRRRRNEPRPAAIVRQIGQAAQHLITPLQAALSRRPIGGTRLVAHATHYLVE